MRVKNQKSGDRQGLGPVRNVLKHVCPGVGHEVDGVARDGVIVAAPTKRIRGRYRIEDLVEKIPEDYRAGETDWGEPVGKEAWERRRLG